MDLQEILASLFGGQGPSVGFPSQVGDHANPAAMMQAQQSFAQPPAMRPQTPQQQPQQAQMPPQAPQGQPMPPNAPQTAPAPAGGILGGLGGMLQNIIAPQAAAKNKTVGWLTQQGLDPGLATILASDKGALRSYMVQRTKGNGPTEFDQRAAAAQQYKLDPSTPEGRNFILTGKLGSDAPQREIKNDANGVPRFVDTGAAVYPSDQSASAGTQFFSGRSVEAQGLNYLIGSGKLTKEQASNVAAGKPVTGPNGEIIFMTPQGIFQQPASGGAPEPVQPGSDTSGGNIQITGPKYSEDMRKAGGFAVRADAADKIVSNPDVTAAGKSYGQNLENSAPFGLGNYLTSDNFQSFDQAQRDFVNAVLRRESGAAISESEFQNARKQYLPQPGDGKVVLDQKAANRKLAIQSLQKSADPVPSMGGAAQSDGGAPAPKAAPAVGETRYGYRFKGGDPSEPSSWEKAN